MKKFNSLKLNAKFNNYFSKIILTYFFMFVVILLIFSISSLASFSYQLQNIIYESNEKRLDQLNSFMDNYLLNKIYNISNKCFTENSEYPEFYSFFYDFNKMTVPDSIKVSDSLETILGENKFLDSIYLYNSTYDALHTPRRGTIYDVSYYEENIGITPSFFHYLKNIETDFWISPYSDSNFVKKEGTLTYVHYLPSSTENVANKNIKCVIYNIKSKDIIDFINDIVTSNLQNFIIVNKDKKVLLNTNPELDPMSESLDSDWFEHIFNPKAGVIKAKLGGKTLFITSVTSTVNDWHYIYAFYPPNVFSYLKLILPIIILIMLMLMYLGFLLINKYTKRFYYPIEKIIQNIKSTKNYALNTNDETHLLHSFVDSIDESFFSDIANSAKYQDLIAEKIFSDLLNGLITEQDTNSIKEQFEHVNITFDHNKFRLITIELNYTLLNKLPVAQRELIILTITDKIAPKLHVHCFRSSMNVISILINYSTIDLEQLFKEIKETINYDNLINIYYSKETELLTDFSTLHSEALSMLKYSYIYNFDNIFEVAQLLILEQDPSIISATIIQAAENSMITADKDKFKDICNNVFNEVKARKHSFMYAQGVILQIFSVICRCAKEQKIPIKDDGTFDKIMQNYDFDSSVKSLFELADNFFNKYKEQDYYKTNDLISNITRYIYEHISDNITLTNVADHFNISPGYLSKFFKDNMNVPFSKYVADKKFELAAIWLVENPELSIEEIINKLGYFDTAYFGRLFKARYAMTPLQYRKAKTSS